MIFVIFILWLGENKSLKWAGILGSLPIAFVFVVLYAETHKVRQISLSYLFSACSILSACVIFFSLTISGFNTTCAIIVAALVWLTITTTLYLVFADEFLY